MKSNNIETFFEVFNLMADYDDLIAFRYKDKEFTYKDLRNQVLYSINNLSSFNDKRIGIMLDDTYDFIILYFAVVLSNNTAVLLTSEKEFSICDLIIDSNNKDIYLKKIKEGTPKIRDKASCATILFSSGTHGEPKGVMLSEVNLISDTFSGKRMYRYDKGMTYLHLLPNTHAFGLVCDLFGPLFSGGTICLMESKYDFLNALVRFNPDSLNIVPALLETLYKCLKTFKFNLKKVISGGAGTDYKMIKKFYDIGVNVHACYGLSECAPCVSIAPEGYPLTHSSGKILDCNTITIIDNEICIEGSNVMIGYFNEEPLKGIYHTGDLGYIKDGEIYLTGRIDDLIILDSGIKLSPQYIESLVNEKGAIESILKKENGNVVLKIVSENELDLSDISEMNYIDRVIYTKEPLLRTATGKLIR